MIIQLVTNKMLLKRSNDLYWLLNSIIWKVASVVTDCDRVITKLLSYFVRKHTIKRVLLLENAPWTQYFWNYRIFLILNE